MTAAVGTVARETGFKVIAWAVGGGPIRWRATSAEWQ